MRVGLDEEGQKEKGNETRVTREASRRRKMGPIYTPGVGPGPKIISTTTTSSSSSTVKAPPNAA